MTQFVIISTKRRILRTVSTEKKPIKRILEGLLTKRREVLLRWNNFFSNWWWRWDDWVDIGNFTKKRWNFFSKFFFSTHLLLQNCSISCHSQNSITMLVGSIQCMLPITSLDCPFIRAHCFTRWRLKGVKKLISCRRYKMHCGKTYKCFECQISQSIFLDWQCT